MVSFVAVTTRGPDFWTGFAAERLGGGGGGAGSWAGSLGASTGAGGGASGFGGFGSAGGFAGAAFFAGAFEHGDLGLAGAGAAACAALCCADCQAGMWEAALLARSFFDSGCLE